MINRDTIEQAYCFFHQKWRVYAGKSSETQRDDIEYAISSYADTMDRDLYSLLSGGDNAFLREHTRFSEDINRAQDVLEAALERGLLMYNMGPEVEAFSTMREAVLPYELTQAHQVHGTEIAFIDRNGVTREELEGYDALVTALPGCAIAARTADCIPVLLFDPVHKVAAAVHSGWRGTVQKISAHVVRELSLRYGTMPGDLRAVIGPGIGPDSFQVGEEVVLAFKKAGFPMEEVWEFQGPVDPEEPSLPDGRKSMRGGHHVDLWSCCRHTLLESGLSDANIQTVRIDTYASPDFFSARREGISCGRILNAIMLTAE